jgi:nucleoside phosphorylase
MAADRAGLVVLTALDLEYQAVRAHLTGLQRRPHSAGTLFEVGRLHEGGGRVAIAVTGEGNPGAAVLAERAIAMFRPQALLFVGVAGGLKDDISLGDVVVATKTYAYHGGKDGDKGFLSRPRAWEAPHELDQISRYVARSGSWIKLLTPDSIQQPPTVHFKPIAAGEVLLNSRDTPLAQQLLRTYNDAVAIEMESAGVSQAGHLNRSLPVLTVRGISDKADGAKHTTDGAGWQPVAAAHAAAFAVALAAEIFARGTDDSEARSTKPPQRQPDGAQNIIAYPGSVAYGVLDGNLHINQPAPPAIEVMAPARIRPGQPGNEGSFQPVYQAFGGIARLGEALGEVYLHELGWVQHFQGGPSGEPAVFCARFGHPVVVVAQAVWNEILAAGGGGPAGGASGIGFPVARQFGWEDLIGSDSEVVELAGGNWGRTQRGRLVRRPPRAPVWQPKVCFDSDACKDRDVWTDPTDKRDLRVRVAARIPLLAEEWRIASAGRARMLAALNDSDTNEVIQRLAERYGIDGNGIPWREIDEPAGRNNSRFTAHQVVVAGADDRPALAICARLMVPDGRACELQSTVDLRVDFDAIGAPFSRIALSRVPIELRLSLTELTGFFTRAWHLGTMILPLAAAESLLDMPPAGAPRLELYIQSERTVALGGDRMVPIFDMIDVSTIGTPRNTHLRELAVAVTTPLGLPELEIVPVVNDAMVRMAEDFGFADAEAGSRPLR